MPRMTPCPSCHGHVLLGDRECPHCGATLHTTTATRASAVLLGLALTGCPSGEDDTSSETMTSLTVGASSGPTTDGSGSADNTATLGEADYGVAETGPFPDDNGNESTGPLPDDDTTGEGSTGSGSSTGNGSSTGGNSSSGSDSSGGTSTTG